jgi:hypothetical protein
VGVATNSAQCGVADWSSSRSVRPELNWMTRRDWSRRGKSTSTKWTLLQFAWWEGVSGLDILERMLNERSMDRETDCGTRTLHDPFPSNLRKCLGRVASQAAGCFVHDLDFIDLFDPPVFS